MHVPGWALQQLRIFGEKSFVGVSEWGVDHYLLHQLPLLVTQDEAAHHANDHDEWENDDAGKMDVKMKTWNLIWVPYCTLQKGKEQKSFMTFRRNASLDTATSAFPFFDSEFIKWGQNVLDEMSNLGTQARTWTKQWTSPVGDPLASPWTGFCQLRCPKPISESCSKWSLQVPWCGSREVLWAGKGQKSVILHFCTIASFFCSKDL